MWARNPRSSISPMQKLYQLIILTHPDVQCCSLVHNLLDLTVLRQYIITETGTPPLNDNAIIIKEQYSISKTGFLYLFWDKS